MTEKKFGLHFKGGDLSPKTVLLSDLAELLCATENVLFSIALEHNVKLDKDVLGMYLSDIQANSLDLQIGSTLPEVVEPTFRNLAKALKSNFSDSIPDKAIMHLEKIVQFLNRRQAELDMVIDNGITEKLVTVPVGFSLPKASYISGDTTIYGEIVRVGGVDPKVEIKTFDGDTLYCPFNKELAGRLGEKLYQTVGLLGKAKWDITHGKIVNFTVMDIIPYRTLSITEAFEKLSELSGKYYADIDPDKYINDLRGE